MLWCIIFGWQLTSIYPFNFFPFLFKSADGILELIFHLYQYDKKKIIKKKIQQVVGLF